MRRFATRAAVAGSLGALSALAFSEYSNKFLTKAFSGKKPADGVVTLLLFQELVPCWTFCCGFTAVAPESTVVKPLSELPVASDGFIVVKDEYVQGGDARLDRVLLHPGRVLLLLAGADIGDAERMHARDLVSKQFGCGTPAAKCLYFGPKAIDARDSTTEFLRLPAFPTQVVALNKYTVSI